MKQLSLVEKAFFLKKTFLFKDLDLDLLIAIADNMSQDIYDAQEKTFDINQRANRMYFIVHGSVEILDNDNKVIQTLNSTDFFGDESLFNDKLRQYKSICKTDSLILTITKTNLLNVISECPSVALALLKKYAQITPCRKET